MEATGFGDDAMVDTVAGDIADAAQVAAVIGTDAESIFHLAAVVSAGAEADFDLGMAVNLAQRIEAQCKTYGVELLVSADTVAGAPEFAVLHVDLALLPGSNAPIDLYALVGDEALAGSEAFAAWKAAHDEMRVAYQARDFAQALALAGRAQGLADAHHKRLYEHYLARFERLRQEGVPDDWDGVVVLLDK